MLANVCLRLLLDTGLTRGLRVRLGGAGGRAQRVEGVVIGATETLVQGGDCEGSHFVFGAEGPRAEITDRGGWRPADAAVMPRTFPTSIWWLGEAETQEMVGFWTVLLITHDQLSCFSTTETEILLGVLCLWSQLPLLGP